MKVLVIPEDPTNDQHILKPVVQRVFKDLGRPKTRVEVLQDPCIRGVEQALSWQAIDEILARYFAADLFLLIVDRDGQEGRHVAIDARVQQARDAGKALIGCLAVEEVEVWALALHASELPDRWSQVRKECDPKERYFQPLARAKGWLESKGRGRAEAMKALAGNWRALQQRCPEVQHLREHIGAWLAAG
jgi:hypothetical protein